MAKINMELLRKHIEEIYGNEKHDIANCSICNPKFVIILSRDELENVRKFTEKEGWNREVKSEFEMDCLDYETLINEDLIQPKEEIEKFHTAVNTIEEAMEEP